MQTTRTQSLKYQTSEDSHLHQSFSQSSVHGIHKEDTFARLPQDKKWIFQAGTASLVFVSVAYFSGGDLLK